MSPYSYCGGSPVRYVDPDGDIWHVVGGAVVGAVIDASIAFSDGKTGSEIAGAAVKGAITGATIVLTGMLPFTATAAIYGANIAAGVVSSAVGSVAEQAIADGQVDGEKVAIDAVFGAFSGAAGVGMDNALTKFSDKAKSVITSHYRNGSVRKAFEKEVKREMRTSGRSTSGKAGKAMVDRETSTRLKDNEAFDNVVIEKTKGLASFTAGVTISKSGDYLSNKVL